MHYVIYPDTLFLENFLCNLLFLIFFKNRFFHRVTWRKVMTTAAFTALCNTLISIMCFRFHWLLQVGLHVFCAGILVGCSVGIRDKRRIFYLFYQMLIWVLVFGGILQVLEQWKVLSFEKVFLAVLSFTVILGVMEKVMAIYERQGSCMREVILYWGGKCCHFQGFADTGNQLIDPLYRKPVSMISPDAWDLLLKDSEPPCYYRIPYRTVGNACAHMQGAQIDFMVIRKGNDSRVIERPIIAITEEQFAGLFHYSVLLHNEYC